MNQGPCKKGHQLSTKQAGESAVRLAGNAAEGVNRGPTLAGSQTLRISRSRTVERMRLLSIWLNMPLPCAQARSTHSAREARQQRDVKVRDPTRAESRRLQCCEATGKGASASTLGHPQARDAASRVGRSERHRRTESVEDTGNVASTRRKVAEQTWGQPTYQQCWQALGRTRRFHPRRAERGLLALGSAKHMDTENGTATESRLAGHEHWQDNGAESGRTVEASRLKAMQDNIQRGKQVAERNGRILTKGARGTNCSLAAGGARKIVARSRVEPQQSRQTVHLPSGGRRRKGTPQ